MMGSGSLFSNGLNGFCGERKQMLRCGHQPCTPVAPQLHPAPLNSREGVTRQPAPMSLGCASARPDGYTLLEATFNERMERGTVPQSQFRFYP